MSRANIAASLGDSPRSAKLLASASSFAQRLQLSLEGLGGVSNLLALTGVGTGLVVSCLTGMLIDRSLELSIHDARKLTSGFSGSAARAVDL